MEQTTFPISQTLSLERLVSDALSEIERLGYSRRSRNRYRATWEHLIEFSDRKAPGGQFSGELAARFLAQYRVGDDETDSSGQGWRRHMIWGVKVLADFAESGRIDRGKTELEAIHLVPSMQKTLRDYEKYCKNRLHLRPSTLHQRTTELTIFLDFLHSRKARTLHDIQPLDVSEFMSWRDHLQPKTVARIVSDVGCFLRFLTMRGILQQDLSEELPKVRVPRDAKIPSVWEQELVARSKLPSLNRTLSPHTLRHAKGMHLLQSGISLDMIRDFLGHVDVKTTQIYARANLEMKRQALEKISEPSPVPTIPSWQHNKDLLDWLRSL